MRNRRFSAMNPPTHADASAYSGYQMVTQGSIAADLNAAIDTYASLAGRDNTISLLKIRLREMGEDAMRIEQMAPRMDKTGQVILL